MLTIAGLPLARIRPRAPAPRRASGSRRRERRDARDPGPSVGAAYDVAVGGLSLSLILLTALLLTVVMVYVLGTRPTSKNR
jgi:hypothetical protein